MIFIPLIFGVSFFLLAFMLIKSSFSQRQQIAQRSSSYVRVDSFLYRFLAPITIRLSLYLSKLETNKYLAFLQRKISMAGLSSVLKETDILSYQLVLSFVLSLLGLMVGSCFFSAFLGFFGLCYPIFWLNGCRYKIVCEIEESFPDVLDSLSLSVQAGIDFISAIQRVVTQGEDNVLKGNLREMLSKIKLGKRRVDALNELKQNLVHPYINSFVSILIQADRFGVSISQALQMYSKKMRDERLQAVEKKGVLASQKILIPLVFCIMPAVFVVVFAPVLIMWINGSLFKLF